jgi:hypothetical protein
MRNALSQSTLAPFVDSRSYPSAAQQRDREAVASRLAQAGVTLGGSAACDIQVHDPRAYRAMLSGRLGFGEAYMAGLWSCERLDELTAKLSVHDLSDDPPTPRVLVRAALARVANMQSKARAFRVAEAHYDAGRGSFRGDARSDDGVLLRLLERSGRPRVRTTRWTLSLRWPASSAATFRSSSSSTTTARSGARRRS